MDQTIAEAPSEEVPRASRTVEPSNWVGKERREREGGQRRAERAEEVEVGARPRRVRRTRRARRARARRLRTVPTGQPRRREASSWVRPSK
jgi:hypothetical protein